MVQLTLYRSGITVGVIKFCELKKSAKSFLKTLYETIYNASLIIPP